MTFDDPKILRLVTNKSVEFLNDVASKWLNEHYLKIYNMMLFGVPISGRCRACKRDSTAMKRETGILIQLMRAYCWRQEHDKMVTAVYRRNLTRKQVKIILLLERKISQRVLARMLGLCQYNISSMSSRITKRLKMDKSKEAKDVMLYLKTVLHNYKFSRKLRKEVNEKAKAVQSVSEFDIAD